MMKLMCLLRTSRGSTLLEAVVATAIFAIFFAGLYATNGRAMSMLKQSVECTAATSSLQNRLERVRSSTWEEITDPTFLQDKILSEPAGGERQMPGFSEVIAVNTYPEPAGYDLGQKVSATIEVMRTSGGAATVTAFGDGTLATARAIRVDCTTSWQSGGTGTTRMRQVSTVISHGGLAGRNR
jgi:hypothetical protein